VPRNFDARDPMRDPSYFPNTNFACGNRNFPSRISEPFLFHQLCIAVPCGQECGSVNELRSGKCFVWQRCSIAGV